MQDEGLKDAEAHLETAEADLKAAQTAERTAEDQIEEAIHEIQEAEQHRHQEIHFEVDGEPCETTRHELTPNEIIQVFGKKDPADNYLVQIIAGRTDSYQGKGDIPIKMHNGLNFQIVSTGPKPVSHGPIIVGVALFADGLRTLGFEPKCLPNKADHVIIDYIVPSGRFTGRLSSANMEGGHHARG